MKHFFYISSLLLIVIMMIFVLLFANILLSQIETTKQIIAITEESI